ncbi:MAG: HAMP domain-containing histidine kinase, partial [Verrucomicrobiae bacterium]|nr:HAMP domain-containing histidine kinase [Verrucomicrobiae bacterium]
EKNPVNYSELLTEACEDAELLAAAANIKLETQIQPDIHGLGDPNHLRRLLLNLLDNACKHNRSGGEAKCFLEKDDRGAVLRIGNTGPGIPPEKRERVFERFFLSDPSRSNSRGHGLGLALCWEIVELHGGQLSLSKSSGPDWTEFVVILPVEP